MQKLLFTSFNLLLTLVLVAQPSAPRYALLEHVTNSRCSVCASRNPAMYNLLAQHTGEVHHLAYHPSFPYSNCIFYQANTTENNARAAYYGVSSTPKVVLNGTLVPPATQLLPAATLEAALDQTSPVYVQVTETATMVNVTIHTLGTKPDGDYKLFVAFAEETVNYNAPNGENVHHDVFRDMLSNIEGENITLSNTGGSVSFAFTKTTNAAWNADEMYALAWVQNAQDKEVLNSGTRFDPVVSGLNEPKAEPLSLSPNPTTGTTVVALPAGETASEVAVYSIAGNLVKTDWSNNGTALELDLSSLANGLYFVQVRSESKTFTGKLIKTE